MSYPQIDDMVTTMQGQSCTANWDMLVNYSVNELNTLLQQIWLEKKMPGDTIIFDLSLPGIEIMKYHVEVTLAPPSLSFDPIETGKAILSFPMSGFYRIATINPNGTVTPGTSTFFPTRSSMKCSVPIAGVSGDGSSSEPVLSGGIIAFDPTTTLQSYVVMRFQNTADTIWTSVPPPGSDPSVSTLFSQFGPWVSSWFSNPTNVKEIDFSFA
ncbi:Ff.00g065230.m01.CDS01 [Fusarium sp. VM40]|nr:Ff.00g065230.m01.CDS01 [Fusarium sp. VM40]